MFDEVAGLSGELGVVDSCFIGGGLWFLVAGVVGCAVLFFRVP